MYNSSIKLNEKDGDIFAADLACNNIACMYALKENYPEAAKLLHKLKTDKAKTLAKKDPEFNTMRKLPKFKTIFE